MQTQIKSQNSTSTSKRFVIVLLEEFAIYSFGSLLDALRIANALSGKTLYNWIILAENGAVIRSSAEHDDPTRNVTYNATLRQHGIFKSPAKLYPSLAITSKDLDQTKAAVEHAVRSIS